MQNVSDLPYGIRAIIAGFGDPTVVEPSTLPEGARRWVATWNGLGVSAQWDENAAGHTVIGTFRVNLDDRIWRGRKPIFTQIVSASRVWAD